MEPFTKTEPYYLTIDTVHSPCTYPFPAFPISPPSVPLLGPQEGHRRCHKQHDNDEEHKHRISLAHRTPGIQPPYALFGTVPAGFPLKVLVLSTVEKRVFGELDQVESALIAAFRHADLDGE